MHRETGIVKPEISVAFERVDFMEESETAIAHNLKEGVGVSEFRAYDDDERLRKFLDKEDEYWCKQFEKLKRKPKKYKPKNTHPK